MNLNSRHSRIIQSNPLRVKKTIKGTFAGFRVQNWTITGLEYLFGDIDGCESHRETFVAIQCGQTDRLIKLDEIDSCSYS